MSASASPPPLPTLVASRRRGVEPVWWLVGAVHAGALAAVLVWPSMWLWAIAAVVLSHGGITALTLTPRTQWLGPNLVRLPETRARRGEVALTLDDGPDPQLTPAVLDLLDRYGAKASFFCIGQRVAQHPELAREIVRRGHRVENHSAHHRHNFALLGPRGYRRELEAAQSIILSAVGRAPRFFRAPAGFRNPFLWPALRQTGLQLASWTRRGFDTRDADAQRVLRRLLRNLSAGDILLLHDGHAARDASGRPIVLDVLPALLEALQRQGLRAVALDPEDEHAAG